MNLVEATRQLTALYWAAQNGDVITPMMSSRLAWR